MKRRLLLVLVVFGFGFGCRSGDPPASSRTQFQAESDAAAEIATNIAGGWKIMFELEDGTTVTKQVSIEQNGNEVTLGFAHNRAVRFSGSLSGQKLFVQGHVMNGSDEMVETYNAVVSEDGRAIDGTIDDHNTVTGETSRGVFRMERD
ncbi:MAG: hypothetical protein ABFS45_25300 [Pseudomonadota bacterium]